MLVEHDDKRGQKIAALLLPRYAGELGEHPNVTKWRDSFIAGSIAIRDSIRRQELTPLATYKDIDRLKENNPDTKTLIDFVFEEIGKSLTDPVPKRRRFTVFEANYIGADGRSYKTLPKYIPKHIAPHITAMQNAYLHEAQENNGEPPPRPGLIIESGYRSPNYQVAIMAQEFVKQGYDRTHVFVKRPGESQHADFDNVAIDLTNIGNGNGSTTLTNGTKIGFEQTQEFDWLLANAHNFGLWLPYHPDPADPTQEYGADGFLVEPWHFQFNGARAADLMQSNNVVTLFEKFKAGRSNEVLFR